MADRPILFSGPMVRAILDGRKTMMRQVITDHTSSCPNWRVSQLDLSRAYVDAGPSPAGNPGPCLGAPVTVEAMVGRGFAVSDDLWDRVYPRWQVGDGLWVREAFYIDDVIYECGPLPKERPEEISLYYRADGDCCEQIPECQCAIEGKPHMRPSIHMPRWASRITLEVTAVRVERVQKITEEDARAEGISDGGCLSCGHSEPCGCSEPRPDARDAFAYLWDSLNARRGYEWVLNPWVWVTSFRRIER